MADLSVIVVNYNSGWFLTNLVDSLMDQEFTNARGEPGTLEIVAVDNASPTDQRAWLDPLAARGVKVVYSDINSGYAGGNNRGMAEVTSDWVMITNPDVVLLPGSLQTLLDALYHDPRVGMAGPRGYLDPELHFLLPPMGRKDLRHHLYESAGRFFKRLGRRFSMERARYAAHLWFGPDRIPTDAISGFCFLMPADLARQLGPFDERFPFYYEDDDLSVRVHQAGRTLCFVGGARVIHFYNKSAGPVFDEVMKKYYRSKSFFYRKHNGPFGHWLYKASTEFLKTYQDRLQGSRFDPVRDLGAVDVPLELDLPDAGETILELTMDPAYVMAVGHRHKGGVYRVPQATWDALDAATYFLRVLDRSASKVSALYRFKKTSAGKASPAYRELKERWS